MLCPYPVREFSDGVQVVALHTDSSAVEERIKLERQASQEILLDFETDTSALEDGDDVNSVFVLLWGALNVAAEGGRDLKRLLVHDDNGSLYDGR